MQEPQIIEKPDLLVVGFEASFIHALSPDANNHEVIGPLWSRICEASDKVSNRADENMYGIIYARAESERTHSDELQYIAAVSVHGDSEIPDGMVTHKVPAGTFAVFTHRGPISGIAKTCEEIYRQWLPQSPYECTDVADVESYDRRFHPESEESEMEYWISVRPKESHAT